MRATGIVLKSLMTGAGKAGQMSVAATLLLLGACSVPDWADPSSYFEPSYGPAPQPVSRAGAPTVRTGTPAEGLTSASRNVQRDGAKTVAAVAEPRATTPTAATPRVAAAAPRTPERPRTASEQLAQATTSAPTAQATAATQQVAQATQPARPARAAVTRPATPTATTTPTPTRVAAALPRATQTPSRTPAPRAATAPTTPAASGASPTPMIAAMTQGQQPPSFTQDGGVVPRRTDVQQTEGVTAGATGTVQTATGAATPVRQVASNQPSGAGTRVTSSTAQPTATQPTSTLSRTYDQELRAAGISPASTAAAPTSGRVQPGQFPQSVSPVVRQTYQESLTAPRSYQEAIGGSPGSSVGSSGSTVISGYGVSSGSQPAYSGSVAGQPDTTVLFRHGSAALSANDLNALRQTASAALNRNSNIEVRGHASSRTGQMPVDRHLLANLRISARRAEAVADALARFGVPYERIRVVARGDNAPAYNEAMPRGEAGNRRAEVYLVN